MAEPLPIVAILGASGLIGEAIAIGLAADGFSIVPIARRFAPHQENAFGAAAVTCPIANLDTHALAGLLSERQVDIVVNCLGVLQDSERGGTSEVHCDFVSRLIAALKIKSGATLLVHFSVPGRAEDDDTPFSRTKRMAERLIAQSSLPFVILRPGFVVAATAYGGSALIRALAALPFDLPVAEAGRPFAATGIEDLVRTLTIVGRRWQNGERRWSATWEVMARGHANVADVIDAFRRHFGGPKPWLRLAPPLLEFCAKAGDLLARFGWMPPIRSAALREMRRGVEGDPASWIAATAIEPLPLAAILSRLPSTIQDRWFARLYLAKPLVLGSLALFWIASGTIAMTMAFESAASILTAHGFAPSASREMTCVSSLADVFVGLAIAFRKTCRAGLFAGIGLSLFYMAAATLAAPDLWVEPLGSLVKTIPAIVLMGVALAILDDR